MKRQMESVFFLIMICILLSNTVAAQKKSILISTRISLQSDCQKANFKSIPPDTTIRHSTTTLNWGFDLLSEKYLTKNLGIYLGIGYYKNTFNFIRGYDHELLNIGTDSIGIYTRTHNYTYHLFRVPVGFTYSFKKQKKYLFSISVEDILNFSFKQVYNGAKPFPNANNKYSNFKYYGNSVLLLFRVSKQLSSSSFLQLAPYIRVSNIYQKKDKFLYEYDTKPYSRFFDAIGLSVEYSFNPKNIER